MGNKSPLLCLKLKVPSALFKGSKISLKHPPIEKDGHILIPREVTELLGLKSDCDYTDLDSINSVKLVFSEMGLLIFDDGEDFVGLTTERDTHLLLSLAHSFIFDIDFVDLSHDYAPATDKEREGFIRIGRQLRDMLLARNNKHPFVFGSQDIFDKLRAIYSAGEETCEYN